MATLAIIFSIDYVFQRLFILPMKANTLSQLTRTFTKTKSVFFSFLYITFEVFQYL